MRGRVAKGHLDSEATWWHHSDVLRRPSKPLPLTRDEVTQLIAMFMRIEWKLDLVLEEMEIDYGQEEDRP